MMLATVLSALVLKAAAPVTPLRAGNFGGTIHLDEGTTCNKAMCELSETRFTANFSGGTVHWGNDTAELRPNESFWSFERDKRIKYGAIQAHVLYSLGFANNGANIYLGLLQTYFIQRPNVPDTGCFCSYGANLSPAAAPKNFPPLAQRAIQPAAVHSVISSNGKSGTIYSHPDGSSTYYGNDGTIANTYPNGAGGSTTYRANGTITNVY